jgi:hypothetical protein
MFIRTSFSSVLLASALLAGTCFSTPALAQKGAVLAPVTGWAITKVADDAANPYCALARRFRQNTILTLAQNLQGETSLALDFQAPRLDPAQSMTIVLDPGAGQQRSFHVAPVSAKAFVVRLGQDVRFFDALQTTGSLRIDVAGEAYNFNLSDIDTGNNRLGSCVASLTEPAAGGIGGGDDRVASLRQDIESLRQENRRLSGLASQTSGDDVIVQEMSREMDVLQSANHNLRSKAAASGLAAGDAMGEVGNAANLGALRAERASLQSDLQSASAARRDAEEIQYKLAALERENNNLRAAADGARRAGRSASPQSEIFVLKEENTRLQKLLEQRSGTPVVVEALQARVFTLEQENAKLAANAQQMNDGEPLALIAPAAGEVAAPLQQKVDELNAQLRERDQKLVQLSNLTMEMENLKSRNAELEKQMLERATDKEAIAGLNNKIRELQEENNRLISQLQQPTGASAPAEASAVMAQENAELKKQIEVLRQSATDVTSLRAELDKLRAENENLKAENASKQSPANSEEIATLRRENEDLKQKVANLTSEKENVIQENRSLKDRLADLMKSAKESVGLGGAEAVSKKEDAVKETAKNAAQDVAKDIAKESPQELVPVAEQAIEAVPPVIAEQQIMGADAAADGMTEAQRQEAMMRQNLREKPPVPVAAPVPAPPVKAEMPAMPVESPAPAVVSETAPVVASKERAAYKPSFSVQDVVADAQVAGAGDVRLVENASSSQRRAYQWRSGEIYGSAEQSPMASAGGFEKQIDNYIAKTRKRCTGDFAAVADAVRAVPGGRTMGYEIACVGQGVNSTASLLFIDKAGTFTVIATETTADKMDDAMDMRDRLQQAAGKS